MCQITLKGVFWSYGHYENQRWFCLQLEVMPSWAGIAGAGEQCMRRAGNEKEQLTKQDSPQQSEDNWSRVS